MLFIVVRTRRVAAAQRAIQVCQSITSYAQLPLSYVVADMPQVTAKRKPTPAEAIRP